MRPQGKQRASSLWTGGVFVSSALLASLAVTAVWRRAKQGSEAENYAALERRLGAKEEEAQAWAQKARALQDEQDRKVFDDSQLLSKQRDEIASKEDLIASLTRQLNERQEKQDTGSADNEEEQYIQTTPEDTPKEVLAKIQPPKITLKSLFGGRKLLIQHKPRCSSSWFRMDSDKLDCQLYSKCEDDAKFRDNARGWYCTTWKGFGCKESFTGRYGITGDKNTMLNNRCPLSCGHCSPTTTTTTITTTTYQCPHKIMTGIENMLACNDGTMCNATNTSINGWGCCGDRGGNKACPPNRPIMCDRKSCNGGHCCETDCSNDGGELPCCQDIEVRLRWSLSGRGAPEIMRDRKWRPFCGHMIWLSVYGPALICKKMGYENGHLISAGQRVYEDAVFFGACPKHATELMQCIHSTINAGSMPDFISPTCCAGGCTKGFGPAMELQCTGNATNATTSCGADLPDQVARDERAAKFVYGEHGWVKCPYDGYVIEDPDTCKEPASILGKKFTGTTKRNDLPRGCFMQGAYFEDSAVIFYNDPPEVSDFYAIQAKTLRMICSKEPLKGTWMTNNVSWTDTSKNASGEYYSSWYHRSPTDLLNTSRTKDDQAWFSSNMQTYDEWFILDLEEPVCLTAVKINNDYARRRMVYRPSVSWLQTGDRMKGPWSTAAKIEFTAIKHFERSTATGDMIGALKPPVASRYVRFFILRNQGHAIRGTPSHQMSQTGYVGFGGFGLMQSPGACTVTDAPPMLKASVVIQTMYGYAGDRTRGKDNNFYHWRNASECLAPYDQAVLGLHKSREQCEQACVQNAGELCNFYIFGYGPSKTGHCYWEYDKACLSGAFEPDTYNIWRRRQIGVVKPPNMTATQMQEDKWVFDTLQATFSTLFGQNYKHTWTKIANVTELSGSGSKYANYTFEIDIEVYGAGKKSRRLSTSEGAGRQLAGTQPVTLWNIRDTMELNGFNTTRYKLSMATIDGTKAAEGNGTSIKPWLICQDRDKWTGKSDQFLETCQVYKQYPQWCGRFDKLMVGGTYNDKTEMKAWKSEDCCACGGGFKPCPAGQKMDAPQFRTCSKCVPGKFTNTSARSACDNCPLGRYAKLSGQTECDRCAPGSEALTEGLDACVVCPAGQSNLGYPAAEKCTDCKPGFFAKSFGFSTCEACKLGTFTGELGMTQCDPCVRGTFGPTLNTSKCEECGGRKTTLDQAQWLRKKCMCARLMYFDNGTDSCLDCKVGLQCLGDQDKLGEAVPTVKEGYMTLPGNMYSVYKCVKTEMCPPAPLGTCPRGRIAISCAECPPGQVVAGDGCAVCAGNSFGFVPYIGVFFVFFALIAIYKFSNAEITMNTPVGAATGMLVQNVATLFQVLATLEKLNVPWPPVVRSVMSASNWLLLDPDKLYLGCMVGGKPEENYIARVSAIYATVAAMFLLYVLSTPGTIILNKVFKKIYFQKWTLDKLVNSIGAVCQAVFIALVSISLVPHQCYAHPNGKSSILTYPNILCGEDNQRPLFIASCIMLITFNAPFLVVTAWANWTAPERSSFIYGEYPPHFVRFRFLFCKFRPDRWYWGTFFSLRQTMLAAASVINPDDPHGQIIITVVTLGLYGAFVSAKWPWRVIELNLFDSVSATLLMILVAAQASFLPKSPEGDFHAMIMTIAMICMGLLGVGMLAVAFTYMVLRGPKGDFGRTFPRKVNIKAFADNFQFACTEIHEMEPERFEALVESMTQFDRMSLDTVISILRACSFNKVDANVAHNRRLAGLRNSHHEFSRNRGSQMEQEEERVATGRVTVDSKGRKSQAQNWDAPRPSHVSGGMLAPASGAGQPPEERPSLASNFSQSSEAAEGDGENPDEEVAGDEAAAGPRKQDMVFC